MTATLVMAAAGVKFKVVEGFGAPPTMFQAMSSGEVKMAYTSFPGYSRVVDNLNNMKIFPWFQYGNIDDQGNVTRDSLAKDVPTAKCIKYEDSIPELVTRSRFGFVILFDIAAAGTSHLRRVCIQFPRY